MEKIIQIVTTPIALATVAILVFGVVLQRSNVRKDVVGGVFWLILCLGVLGNIGYLLNTFVASDAIMRGSIRETSDDAIASAIIEVEGVGRTASLDDGSFELSIPYSRQRENYVVISKASEHKTERMQVHGPKPEFVSVILKPETLNFADAIEIHTGFGITQNLGDPALYINFRVKKQYPTDVRIAFTQINLIMPSGNELLLTPTFVQVNGQANPGLLGGLNLRDPYAAAELNLLFERSQFAKTATFADIAQRYGQFWGTKCGQPPGPDNRVGELLKKYFDYAFSWKAGTYEAVLRHRINNAAGETRLKFDLQQSDVDRLHAMDQKLDQCRGFALDWSQYSNLTYVDAEASNFLLGNTK